MKDFEEFVNEARSQLSANVELLRKRKSLSQELLAVHAGLHRTFISHVERGHRNLTLDSLAKIAWALEVPLYELFLPQPSKPQEQ